MKNNLYIALAMFLLITFLSRTSFSQGISCRTGLEVRDCDIWYQGYGFHPITGEPEAKCVLDQTDIEKNCTNQTVNGVTKCGYYYDPTFSCRLSADRQSIIDDDCNITGSTFYTCAGAPPSPGGGGGSCKNAVFNADNSTYGPGTSRDPGQLYGVNCDYGVKTNNISVLVGSSPGNCTFYSFEPAPNGTQAQFGCTAPSTPGSYRVECNITSGGSGNICSASTNYRFDLTVNGAPTPTPTNTPTPTPTSTPTPTPIPDDPWCKYKDASIITNAAINNPIPASPLTPYDSSDPGNRVLVDSSSANSAGVVGAQSISIGGAPVSATGWDITGSSFSPQFTIQGYIDYIKSKKSSLINNGSIVSGKINILSGNQTISESDLSGKRPLIVIVEGDITLSSTTNILNQANEPQVIMATGTITFPETMTAANGSYIANAVNFGTTANQGLKIIGNLVSESTLSCTRKWSDTKKPGVFIVFDPSHYIEMIEMLSTTTYDWRQIQ